MAAVYRTNLL